MTERHDSKGSGGTSVSGSVRYARPGRASAGVGWWRRGISRRQVFRGGGLGAAGLGGAWLIGCGGDDEGTQPGGNGAPSGEPRHGGNIRVATIGDVNSLDPAHFLSTADIVLGFNVYDGIVQVMEDLSIKPMLGESLESEDLQHWVVKVREGATWHHGREVTAEDIVFTLERLLNPDTGSPARSSLSFIRDVEATDDGTVNITLDGPNAFLPSTLSLYQGRMLPADLNLEDLERGRVSYGAGPFMVEEWEPGERAILRRNPNYWEDPYPYADSITIFYMPEPVARAEQIRAGAVDAVFPIEPNQAISLGNQAGVVVDETPSAGYVNLSMHCDKPPFEDVRVRQAFQAIMDRDFLREAALFGAGENANDHPIAPNDPMWWPGQEIVPQDIDRARQLLEAAGHGGGLSVTLHTSTVAPAMQELAVTFRELAAPAGVNVDVRRAPEDAYWSSVWLEEPFVTVGWNGRNPDEALSVVYKSDADWNEARYFNADLDQMIDTARGIPGEEERREAYGAIQQLLIEDVPRIIPAFRPIFAAHLPRLHNYRAHPSNWALFHQSWLDA